jgi:hypothetical protein
MLPDSQGCSGDGGATANKVSGINTQLPLDWERTIRALATYPKTVLTSVNFRLTPLFTLTVCKLKTGNLLFLPPPQFKIVLFIICNCFGL